jgi:hypothetical protein
MCVCCIKHVAGLVIVLHVICRHYNFDEGIIKMHTFTIIRLEDAHSCNSTIGRCTQLQFYDWKMHTFTILRLEDAHIYNSTIGERITKMHTFTIIRLEDAHSCNYTIGRCTQLQFYDWKMHTFTILRLVNVSPRCTHLQLYDSI